MSEQHLEEDEIQRMLNFSHWGGRASAMRDFAERLREESGKQFVKGNDGWADHLRLVAQMAENASAKERKFQEQFKSSILTDVP